MEPIHKQSCNNSPEGLFLWHLGKLETLESFLDVQSLHIHKAFSKEVRNKANGRDVLQRRHRISRNRREGFEDNTKKSVFIFLAIDSNYEYMDRLEVHIGRK